MGVAGYVILVVFMVPLCHGSVCRCLIVCLIVFCVVFPSKVCRYLSEGMRLRKWKQRSENCQFLYYCVYIFEEKEKPMSFTCDDCETTITGSDCAHSLSAYEGWKNVSGCVSMCPCKYPVRAKEIREHVFSGFIDNDKKASENAYIYCEWACGGHVYYGTYGTCVNGNGTSAEGMAVRALRICIHVKTFFLQCNHGRCVLPLPFFLFPFLQCNHGRCFLPLPLFSFLFAVQPWKVCPPTVS